MRVRSCLVAILCVIGAFTVVLVLLIALADTPVIRVRLPQVSYEDVVRVAGNPISRQIRAQCLIRDASHNERELMLRHGDTLSVQEGSIGVIRIVPPQSRGMLGITQNPSDSLCIETGTTEGDNTFFFHVDSVATNCDLQIILLQEGRCVAAATIHVVVSSAKQMDQVSI